jgi:hypothetical protein
MTDDVQASIREAVATVSKEQGYTPDKEASGFATQSLDPETPAVAEPEKTPEKTETKVGEEDSIIVDPNAVEEEEETETPVVKEPEKVVEEEEEEALTFSPEDLERIEKDPGLKKIHRSMVRGFTEKTKALSTLKKTYEADHAAIEALKKDPHGVLKQMVEAAGLKLAEEPTPTVPTATEEQIDAEIIALLKANIGEEAANVLGPALVKVVKTVTGKAIAPIQKDNEQRAKSESALRLKSQIADFGTRVVAEGGDWDETVEQEMAALVGKVTPGKDVSLPDFLTILHNTVQTNRRAKEGNKREVVRLKKAKEKDEPVRPTKPAPTPTEPVIAAGMDIKEATRAALDSARRQVASGR